VLINLLGMLRYSFAVLSSKQYFLDFFEDTHVPLPDISGYIREKVKVQSLRNREHYIAIVMATEKNYYLTI